MAIRTRQLSHVSSLFLIMEMIFACLMDAEMIILLQD